MIFFFFSSLSRSSENAIPNQHSSGIARKESSSRTVSSLPCGDRYLAATFKIKGRSGVQTPIKLCALLVSSLSIKKRCGEFLRMAFANDSFIGNRVIGKGQTVGVKAYLMGLWRRVPC